MPSPAETRATAAEAMQTSFAAFLANLETWRAAASAHATATADPSRAAVLRQDRHIAAGIVGAVRTVLHEAHHVADNIPLAVVDDLADVDAAQVVRAES